MSLPLQDFLYMAMLASGSVSSLADPQKIRIQNALRCTSTLYPDETSTDANSIWTKISISPKILSHALWSFHTNKVFFLEFSGRDASFLGCRGHSIMNQE